MSFLYPAFFIGALAAAVPIVLHLLRRDIAPEVPFTAVRLLRRVPVERSKQRRLRDLLLLAARVAALLLLAAAFARPYAPGVVAAGMRIVAIDRSYSMAGPDRFQRALQAVQRAIDDAAAGQRVAVIAFDDRADLLAAPGSASEARAALAGMEPGFGGTRYGAAIEKAVEVAEGGPGRLILVTDLQRGGWEDQQPAAIPPGITVEVKDIGTAPINVAVTSVRAEGDHVLVGVQNSGAADRSGQVRVAIDGREVASAAYSAPAGVSLDVPIAFQVPATGTLAATIDDLEGLPADNTRFAVLGPVPRASVVLVTAGGADRQSGFYLARALGALSGNGRGFDLSIVTGTSLSKITSADLASHSVVVLLSTRGLERQGRDALGAFVRGGGGLMTAAAADVEPAVLSAVLDWNPPLAPIEIGERDLTLAATDLRHPIFRPFGALAVNLGQVRFHRAWRVRPDGWNIAARFTDGTPAVLERAADQGRVVLFASDLDRRWNDFPLHPSFVPFAIESIRYTARHVDAAREYTPSQVPEGVPPKPGIYRVGPEQRAVAVNVDVRESTVSGMTLRDFDAMLKGGSAGPLRAVDVQAERTEGRQSYWRYGLVLMLAALVAESLVGRRSA